MTTGTRGGLLGAADPGLAAHRAAHGRPGAITVGAVRHSGLTGRGGAAFPLWRKLTAVAEAGGRLHRPVVVANGAEGEPASRKDHTLLTRSPHLVLDGLALAAGLVGARRTVAYVRADAASAVRAAVAERRDAGLDEPDVEVLDARPGFVRGEETAVVDAVDGRAGLPRDKGRRAVALAVAGRPALVCNVETLAHLACIAAAGPDAFRARGTDQEPGTMLVTLSDQGRRRVGEVDIGTPLESVLGRVPPGPVLVGGYHGAWLTPAEVGTADLSRAALGGLGAAPGACGLEETARIVGYLAAESAGQCGPCRLGLPALAEAFTALARGTRGRWSAEARDLAATVSGRGACRHPDGTVRLVRSALRVFADDADAHRGGRCLARGRA